MYSSWKNRKAPKGKPQSLQSFGSLNRRALQHIVDSKSRPLSLFACMQIFN